jgi:leucyl aminopeptidase (aminopeptidase T)
MDWKTFQREHENDARYTVILSELRTALDSLADTDENAFPRHLGQQALFYADLGDILHAPGYWDKPEAEIKALNRSLFTELLEYEHSWCNPDYAVARYGLETGQLFATSATQLRQCSNLAFEQRTWEMIPRFESIRDFLLAWNNGERAFTPLRDILTRPEYKRSLDMAIGAVLRGYDPGYDFHARIVMESDLSDLRYLYKYGRYISDYEVETAKFLNAYPQEKIETMATVMLQAYLSSFVKEGKSLEGKDTLSIYFNAGQERLVRAFCRKSLENGFTPLVGFPSGTMVNRQYQYDHRFDNALVVDEAFRDMLLQQMRQTYSAVQELTSRYSGPVFIEVFGEAPFDPVSKTTTLRLSPAQQQIVQTMMAESQQIHDDFMPRAETSFCIIGLPSPEIGDQFTEIFEDTLRLNMLKSEVYEALQKKIIDVLDQAEYVHVLGKAPNRTDIRIALHPMSDPATETVFTNCGADVNIPVGEVYTSPQLKGTTGLLHVRESFLKDLKFTELELEFTDGYTTDWRCANFTDPEENRKYISENLLMPHDRLPLGEFAIGTNTLAYVMAKKYGIIEKMPILIVEKMAPHFAIGDTCYSFEEERETFNPIDNKRIVAKHNEHSIQETPDAYTGVHIDITLAYEDLQSIDAVRADGTHLPIIRDGRFVIPGTDELNEPLDTGM